MSCRKRQEFRGRVGQQWSAQVHAKTATEGCFIGHWRLDGTTPGMRYDLAGGNLINAERMTGINGLRSGQRISAGLRLPAG